MKVKISYVNLGTRLDNGEVVPNLPRNNSRLQVVDFKSVWMAQKEMNPEAGKGTNGMVFPFAVDKFLPIENLKEEGICSNGLVFVDIDCGEIKNEIMNRIEEINISLGSSILTVTTTKKGLHVIFISNPLTCNEYRMMAFKYLASFAWQVNKICGIDLREIPNALDACTFSMKQRLFLRYSPVIFWNDLPTRVKFDTTEMGRLKKEYPMLWNKVDKSGNNLNIPDGLRKCMYANLLAVNGVDKHEYIPHHLRWRLFDSLCCVFVKDPADTGVLFEQWDRCCELIDPVNHSCEWFKQEPMKNKWFQIWIQQKYQWYDEKLLEEFGYVVGGKHFRDWPESIDDLL